MLSPDQYRTLESYADTKAKLVVDNGNLRSLVNGKSYRTGKLELVSLKDLRDRMKQTCPPSAKSKVSAITADIRRLHRSPQKCRRPVSSCFPIQSPGNDRP
ncbi:MAG TPA: hypothetical protein VIQ05_07850 [Tardiphaga sp.]